MSWALPAHVPGGGLGGSGAAQTLAQKQKQPQGGAVLEDSAEGWLAGQQQGSLGGSEQIASISVT